METELKTPNLRRLFIPDPGHVMGESDLDRADAQVVAWDSGAVKLKALFKEHYNLVMSGKEGINLHQVNADNIGCGYKQAKAGVHATNYGAQPPTLARTLGISISDATHFQNKWFETHPEIKKWHRRIEAQLAVNRTIKNAFGYQAQFFDRPAQAFTAALAWIPQSTVALIINHAWLRLSKQMPEVKVLLQVHDSLVFQYPIQHDNDMFRRRLRDTLLVKVPYDDPLTIPVGLKTSRKSWGDCEERAWLDSVHTG